MTLMLMGENSRTVAERVKVELERMLPSLPPGVAIEPFYDRAELVDQDVHTVAKNLIEGGAARRSPFSSSCSATCAAA